MSWHVWWPMDWLYVGQQAGPQPLLSPNLSGRWHLDFLSVGSLICIVRSLALRFSSWSQAIQWPILYIFYWSDPLSTLIWLIFALILHNPRSTWINISFSWYPPKLSIFFCSSSQILESFRIVPPTAFWFWLDHSSYMAAPKCCLHFANYWILAHKIFFQCFSASPSSLEYQFQTM